MTKTPTEAMADDIGRLLRQKRLKEAFALLGRMIESTSNWQLSNALGELEQSYKYMLRYVADGADDPQRNSIYEGIMAKTLELSDAAAGELAAQTSPRLYYSTLRTERLSGRPLEALLSDCRAAAGRLAAAEEAGTAAEAQLSPLRRGQEAAARAVFNRMWTLFPAAAGELQAARSAMKDPDVGEPLKELIVGASLLNLMERFNEPLLLLLLDTYADAAAGEALRLKALCCSLLAADRYRDFLPWMRQTRLRLDSLLDSEEARADIMTVYLQFIRSRTAERIRQKVQDELVPKIMKLRPDLRRKLQDPGFADENDANPDWQEMLDRSGITDKLKELGKMQSEGNDVFLGSFSHLKSFPFFSDVSNWFLPFDVRHSSVSEVFAGKSSLLAAVEGSGVFCDSDKYSFALSVASIPERQREAMLRQIDDQNAQMMEEAAAGLPDQSKRREGIANKYVQNLYRFFNFFQRRAEFYNPFSSPLNLAELPCLSECFSGEDSLRLIAELYFRQESYADALSAYRRLASLAQPTAGLYQKMGYCHESLKAYGEAIESYRRAELLNGGDAWTLKRRAACHCAAADLESAIDCYKRVEAMQPDNVAVANSLANCLLEDGRADEALKYFFKVDYMADKGVRTLRPIAWCSFLTGDYRQSVDYYDRIIAGGPTADDYINRGHALLCGGRLKEAVGSYSAAAAAGGEESLAETIESDRRYLLEAGVDDTLVAVVLDHLRYAFDTDKQKLQI